MPTRHVISALVLVALTAVAAQAQTVRYVDGSASGPTHDGSSWCSAYQQVHEALAEAATNGLIDEIRVADGSYLPDTAGLGDPREATFHLLLGVTLQGGYAGCNDGGDEREPSLYETILSGDIGTNGLHTDNSYHVVTGSFTDGTAVLDGFTITAGQADSDFPRNVGAGMFNESGSPTLLDCRVQANTAVRGGGGMYNIAGAMPLLINCLFAGNSGGDLGGAMHNFSDSHPELVNCAFIGNVATEGGGLQNHTGCDAILTNCTFTANTATTTGGAMHCFDSSPTLDNCILWGNTAPEIFDGGTSASSVTYSCIEGGWPGEGNIAADPLFTDADGRLQPGSPCIDAADNSAVPADVADLDRDLDTAEPLPLDLDGYSRFVDDPETPDTGLGTMPLVDMGAYEYWPDCNTNGIPDDVDIAEGTSIDCQPDGIPDECQLADSADPTITIEILTDDFGDETTWTLVEQGGEVIASGGPYLGATLYTIVVDVEPGRYYDFTIYDSHGDRICCEWGFGFYQVYLMDQFVCTGDVFAFDETCPGLVVPLADCNDNGVPDECDIASGASTDCDANSVPDECDLTTGASADCNTNQMPDECDIASGTSPDCDENDIPDECEAGGTEDCNTNGQPDLCDIFEGTSQDCNNNAVPDECEPGGTEDCNTNGQPDLCDIFVGSSQDCNNNAVADDCEQLPSGTLYVDDDATGGLNDGSNWVNAYLELADALPHGACAADISEIRVAGGIYTPGPAREDTFALADGLAIYGGYAGLENPGDPDARDVALYETVLSGDLNGDDQPDWVNRNDNSHHVVTGSGTVETAVLDGVTITGGDAVGATPHPSGAGILTQAGAPTISNCLFQGNRAAFGGAMFNFDFCTPTLTDCRFSVNRATVVGGAIFNSNSGSPSLTRCTITGNSAYYDGGGMYNTDSDPSLADCTISGNSAAGFGGGMYNTDSAPTLVNCAFSGNAAQVGVGGGMYHEDSSPTLTNCTFSGNAASWGGGICSQRGAQTLANCILWDNAADHGPQIYDLDTITTATFSCVQGGWPGTGNIDTDPLFVDADGPDDEYGTPDDDVHLADGSPCVNAGNNDAVPDDLITDFEGDDRIQQCRVDMGVDETPYYHEDCNENGVSDICDIAEGTSQDCNENAIPDECEIGGLEDCNTNSVPDLCDIYGGTSEDCNENGVPDECDLAAGSSLDCNTNSVPDECDIAACDGSLWCSDCNENNVPDNCDLASGTSPDVNPTDGIPDDCQGVQPVTGACCLGSACIVATEAACLAAGGVYQGDDTNCADVECPTLAPADLDRDGDVDLDDFLLFQQQFTGPQ